MIAPVHPSGIVAEDESPGRQILGTDLEELPRRPNPSKPSLAAGFSPRTARRTGSPAWSCALRSGSPTSQPRSFAIRARIGCGIGGLLLKRVCGRVDPRGPRLWREAAVCSETHCGQASQSRWQSDGPVRVLGPRVVRARAHRVLKAMVMLLGRTIALKRTRNPAISMPRARARMAAMASAECRPLRRPRGGARPPNCRTVTRIAKVAAWHTRAARGAAPAVGVVAAAAAAQPPRGGAASQGQCGGPRSA